MKLRFSFTFKILLPYLVFALLFFVVLLSEFYETHSLVLYLSVAGMVAALFFGMIQLLWLKKSFDHVMRLVGQLTRGNIPKFKASKVKGEIGDLERSLEIHVSNLKNIAAFSRSMATGDFTGRYEKLSSEDEMGDALNSLKGSLMESMKESEIRRREEENRTWSAQGLAKFSSLFREVEDNLHDLSALLMKELVSYTEADVGALFISMDGGDEVDPFLEIAGSFAFDREKQIRRSFKFGEGLVGRCALEKELIYITDLPSDYIKIRSGLGEDAPSSILLVPVLLDNQVLGVMELASLGELPSHQIDFIRQLSDALATTLAKAKANLQNRQLFEQTKKQAEELASQENVFKQNMEQLQQAHERSIVKEAALLKEIETLRKGSS
jgi:methyl-accepting chemotaxis protein